MVDYLNELRESILNAYSGIVQGMVSDNNTISPLEAHIPFISSFVSLVALDPGYNNDDVICAGVALVG